MTWRALTPPGRDTDINLKAITVREETPMPSIIEKLNKKVLIGAAVAMIALLLGIGLLVAATRPIVGRDLPVSYVSGECLFDVTDPYVMAGEMEYIFVGRVIDATSTEYWYRDTMPVTTYDVQVLLNLKGELVADVIQVQKMGGISKDQKTYILQENDFLPVPGEIYLFNSLANNAGLPQLSSQNTNIKLDVSLDKGTDGQDLDSLLREIEATKEYHTYLEALENPIKTTLPRETYISIYDVAYNGQTGEIKQQEEPVQ
jgi:hypothetical protein